MMLKPHRQLLRAVPLLISIAWLALGTVGPTKSEPPAPLNWQSPARLHGSFKKVAGTLSIDDRGVHFSPDTPGKGKVARHWRFVEIQTFDLLTPRCLVLVGYENRGWHQSGDRRFRFELASPVPPPVAAELARRVSKPVRNGDPLPQVASFATLPARHHTHNGGSNGTLRLRDDGIDYVTRTNGETRSWRWTDIQTAANPDPYHLRVVGYRETFELTLKQPLSPELFDRLWDHLYARDLPVSLATERGSQ